VSFPADDDRAGGTEVMAASRTIRPIKASTARDVISRNSPLQTTGLNCFLLISFSVIHNPLNGTVAQLGGSRKNNQGFP
jgi:hypothetical protein